MFGPRPLNKARDPSVWTICFKHCQIEIDCTDVEIPHCGIARTDGRRRLSIELAHTRCLEWLWLWWCSTFDPLLLRRWWSEAAAASFPASEVIRVVGTLWINDADELCRRVFTTSNGHVTTAPAVPAIPPANRWTKVSRSRCVILRWSSKLCSSSFTVYRQVKLRTQLCFLFLQFIIPYNAILRCSQNNFPTFSAQKLLFYNTRLLYFRFCILQNKTLNESSFESHISLHRINFASLTSFLSAVRRILVTLALLFPADPGSTVESAVM